ncbi:DUF4426 domain-containing protein [Aliikangiella coralliicola]|uniref:DUF4426 domain-containing protein n=1 Tax=Aliikangiella coralliicola TaxID=2592383 RepID=A0A545U7B4_9GAMM|nr:DUF4426 domain-containing protein [Aliikangiella coralliicola]TQV85359.1 DUF4426 domain-containing protein [Aliikangiella coralliicola]
MIGFNSKLFHLSQYSRRFLLIITSIIAAFSFTTSANEHTVGDVTVNYNALSAAMIPAEVASQYGITRSGRTGIVNIAVSKSGEPVIANIFGHGKNLAGQLKELAFKEIKEEKAIYYIATFTFRDGEKLIFDLQVQAEKKGILIPVKFKQQLYTQ